MGSHRPLQRCASPFHSVICKKGMSKVHECYVRRRRSQEPDALKHMAYTDSLKKKSLATLQGERPLSHRSSQRAEALRQLRELWLSDEAEQPGTPDLPSASEAPSPLHAAADSCNSHSRASPSAQLEQPEKRKAKDQQERGPSLPSRAQEDG